MAVARAPGNNQIASVPRTVQPPTILTIEDTAGIYSRLAAYARQEGITITVALQRWHRHRKQRRQE